MNVLASYARTMVEHFATDHEIEGSNSAVAQRKDRIAEKKWLNGNIGLQQ